MDNKYIELANKVKDEKRERLFGSLVYIEILLVSILTILIALT